jgi:plasmid maintenance system antidote protein VapI
MQDESLQYATFLASYDRFKLSLGLNDEQAADKIGVSRQTIWKIQKKRQKLTKKLIFKLGEAEIAAGLILPNTHTRSNLSNSNLHTRVNLADGSVSIKKLKIITLRDDVLAIKASLDILAKTVEGLEKRVRGIMDE